LIIGMRSLLNLILTVVCLSPVSSPAVAADVPIIAAASDLQFALRDIAAEFETATGERLRLNFGSSGNFRRQIAQGAPFELYMSADESYVLALHEAGHTVDRGVLYAVGRIAIVAPEEGAELVDESLQELRRRLAAGRINRFAIANPEHAPYGAAARQVLESLELWEAIEARLILGENVAQAAQFALSGETDGGIVAYSLVLAPALRERAAYALIPARHHAPLRQRMVLLNNAGPTARAFYEYLQEDTARRVLARYGFAVPEAEKPDRR
jgi:molybdate transport system substrate-binding protein